MRKCEGIEPRDEPETVDADPVRNGRADLLVREKRLNPYLSVDCF